MDQQPNLQAPNHTNPDSTCTMDLTGVMPQHIQSLQTAYQHQPPMHLPFPSNTSSSRPLPDVPHIPSFSSQNNENHPIYDMNQHNQRFSSNNNQHRPFYDTQPLPFSSTYVNLPTVPPIYYNNNNHHAPPQNIHHNNLFYPTPISSLRYPISLPMLKEPPTPSSPTYIPILTGRSDWCPWSEAVTTAIMGLNLYGHIAEHYNEQWGFDPGSVLTYPPTINPNSSPEEFHAWNLWWLRDGQVLHLLVSRLSPTACTQLPGAGNCQPQRRTAHSVYKELVRLFGGTDFHTAAVTRDELIALRCAPSHVGDYVARWHSGLNKLTLAGHPFDHADSLRHFVNHLPFGSTYDIIRESVLYRLSTARLPEQLPSFESIVERVTNVDLNHTYFQPPCSHHPNNDVPSTTTMPTSKDNPVTPSTSTTTTNTSTQP